jgi:hypothetical protein
VNQIQLLSCDFSPQVNFTHVDGRPDPIRSLQLLPVDTVATKDPAKRAKINYLPDAGANITALTEEAMRTMGIRRKQLAMCDNPPKPPKLADGTPSKGMIPLGIFRGTLTFRGIVFMEDIYVYRNLPRPLLSKWACFGLGILRSDVLEGGNVTLQRVA